MDKLATLKYYIQFFPNNWGTIDRIVIVKKAIANKPNKLWTEQLNLNKPSTSVSFLAFFCFSFLGRAGAGAF